MTSCGVMTDVLMPALSPTMEEGTLAKWHVKVGDKVRSGDVIAEIETDKATMEVEAVDEGVVEALLVPEGTEEVKVNTPIARLKGEGGARAAPSGPLLAAGAEDRPPAGESRSAAASVRRRSGEAAARGRQAAAGRRGRRCRRARAAQPIPRFPRAPSWCKITVRDALRDAMAEEMRRDPDVFLMGEEVAQYQGAYKVSRDLLQEFGDRAGDRHPDHRARLHRPRRRRGDGGAEADRRVHDLQLRHAGD